MKAGFILGLATCSVVVLAVVFYVPSPTISEYSADLQVAPVAVGGIWAESQPLSQYMESTTVCCFPDGSSLLTNDPVGAKSYLQSLHVQQEPQYREVYPMGGVGTDGDWHLIRTDETGRVLVTLADEELAKIRAIVVEEINRVVWAQLPPSFGSNQYVDDVITGPPIGGAYASDDAETVRLLPACLEFKGDKWEQVPCSWQVNP